MHGCTVFARTLEIKRQVSVCRCVLTIVFVYNIDDFDAERWSGHLVLALLVLEC